MNSFTTKTSPFCLALISLSLISGHAIAATTATATTTANIAKASAKKSYLFVETAQKAELTNTTLTLYGVSANTVWFTDRPARNFGKIDTQDFANLWKPLTHKPTLSDGSGRPGNAGFAQVAPNAVMVDQGISKSDAKGNSAGTLQKLGLQGMTLYSPSYDPKTAQMTYKITLQTGTLQKPVQLTDVALFVDNGNLSSTEMVYASSFVPFDSSF